VQSLGLINLSLTIDDARVSRKHSWVHFDLTMFLGSTATRSSDHYRSQKITTSCRIFHFNYLSHRQGSTVELGVSRNKVPRSWKVSPADAEWGHTTTIPSNILKFWIWNILGNVLTGAQAAVLPPRCPIDCMVQTSAKVTKEREYEVMRSMQMVLYALGNHLKWPLTRVSRLQCFFRGAYLQNGAF